MKNSQDDLEGLRFRRECAEEWRLSAFSARNAQSQEVRLQMATVWETLAMELERGRAPEIVSMTVPFGI